MPIRDPSRPTESQAGVTTGERETQTLSGREAALLEKYKVERAKRIRADGLAQFRKSEGELAHFLEDPYARKLQRALLKTFA